MYVYINTFLAVLIVFMPALQWFSILFVWAILHSNIRHFDGIQAGTNVAHCCVKISLLLNCLCLPCEIGLACQQLYRLYSPGLFHTKFDLIFRKQNLNFYISFHEIQRKLLFSIFLSYSGCHFIADIAEILRLLYYSKSPLLLISIINCAMRRSFSEVYLITPYHTSRLLMYL